MADFIKMMILAVFLLGGILFIVGITLMPWAIGMNQMAHWIFK